MIRVNFIYSDGGRKDNGFADERFDCTVRAYALAMNITYAKSHRIFRQFGRILRNRCHFSEFMQAMHPEITYIKMHKPRPRVKTILKKTVVKNAIVRISNHVFCVKNNTILDTGNRQNCIVTDIWYFD